MNSKKVLISTILVVIGIFLVGGGGYYYLKQSCVESFKEEFKDELKTLSEIATYKEIDCNPLARKVEIEEIKAKDGSFYIKEVEFSQVKMEEDIKIPLHLKVEIDDMKINDNNKQRNFNLEFSYNINLKKEKFSLDFSFEEKNRLKYKYEIVLGDFGKEILNVLEKLSNEAQLNKLDNNEVIENLFTLGKVSIDKIMLSIDIKDKTILDEVFKDLAENNFTTPEEEKRKLIESIDQLLEAKHLLSEDVRKSLINLKEFIEGKKKKLTIIIEKVEGKDTSIIKIFGILATSPNASEELLSMFKIKIM